jgi:hypothetical protein
MAVIPKAMASWGLLGAGGAAGGATQVITAMEITVAADKPLTVELAGAEISVELSDEQ